MRWVQKETETGIASMEESQSELDSQMEKLTETDMVVDYEYKFNIVKDSDIVKPDITESIINE